MVPLRKNNINTCDLNPFASKAKADPPVGKGPQDNEKSLSVCTPAFLAGLPLAGCLTALLMPSPHRHLKLAPGSGLGQSGR